MPRATRIEYEGACYHVINRGNYREWVFEEEKTKEAFAVCLAEAAVKMKWVVHGWVVMGNHFHLAVETPEGNLGKGMQWLQVTFAARFNAFRGERGHVFQGRYKAIAVEPGKALGQVCHYIDLNPVRAGIVEVGRLESYPFGSYRQLWKPKTRPEWLSVRATLSAAGGLSDNARGWAAYRGYLQWMMKELKAGREQDFLELSRGMAIGSEGFVEQIRLKQAEGSSRNLDTKGKRQLKEQEWSRQLAASMKRIPAKMRGDTRVSAGWKAAVACCLKARTDVTNNWLAKSLNLGSSTYASKQAGLARRALLGAEMAELVAKLNSKT